VVGSNGKAPQKHLTTAEIVARAREKHSKLWHWGALDIDVTIRPRTTAENADLVDAVNRHNAAIEEYRGTPDEPSSEDAVRLRLRGSIPCIRWPDDGTPMFDHEDIDTLMELDSPSIQELLNEVDTVSNFTAAQAEEAAKNSVATDESSISSVSRSTAATSTFSPTPTPSDT
jgi:hypothetical protein